MGKVVSMASGDLAKKFQANKVRQVKGDGSGKATMNGRILPISDFQKVIEHDKIYLGVLQSLATNLSFHERNLGLKLNPIKDKDSERIKRAKEFVEWDETKIKMYDVRGQIESHNKLLNDKLFHFQNIALPQFEKECKEMENGEFEKQLETSNEIVTIHHEKENDLSDKAKKIVSEIHDELYWYRVLEDDFKKDKEYQLYLFKAIRRLNNAFKTEFEKERKEK